MLVDNAKGHNIEILDNLNVKVFFFAPNMTSVIQPMDAGIINSFKAHYNKLLVKFLLESIETTKEIRLPGVKQALYFIRDAWKAVTQ